MYTSLTFLFSKHPTKVYWRPVFWGIGLQFLLGLLILRTEPGFMAFDWLGKQVQTFLGYTDAGASFVFGEKYTDHFFCIQGPAHCDFLQHCDVHVVLPRIDAVDH